MFFVLNDARTHYMARFPMHFCPACQHKAEHVPVDAHPADTYTIWGCRDCGQYHDGQRVLTQHDFDQFHANRIVCDGLLP